MGKIINITPFLHEKMELQRRQLGYEKKLDKLNLKLEALKKDKDGLVIFQSLVDIFGNISLFLTGGLVITGIIIEGSIIFWF